MLAKLVLAVPFAAMVFDRLATVRQFRFFTRCSVTEAGNPSRLGSTVTWYLIAAPSR
jgi:hypothetical protein